MWQSIKDAFQSLFDFMYRLLLSIFDFLKDFLFFVLDTLFSAAIGLLDLVGAGLESLNPLEYFNQIPVETKSMMAAAGFNEVMVIIVAAILIRFTLQLIPFVRWGS